jgi:hypothetical protein
MFCSAIPASLVSGKMEAENETSWCTCFSWEQYTGGRHMRRSVLPASFGSSTVEAAYEAFFFTWFSWEWYSGG